MKIVNFKYKGFTLVELLVSAAVLVGTLGAYLTTFNRTINLAEQSRDDYLASISVKSKIAEMKSNNFSSIKADYKSGGSKDNKFDPYNLTGKGNIEMTDRKDLYGGGEVQVTAAAAWLPRFGHTSLVYDNKMWIFGGSSDAGKKNDVWYSTNGQTWTQATAAAGWSPRYGHTSLVYDNKMWVIGGFDGILPSPAKNDVWYSADGVNWIRAKPNDATGWSSRYLYTSLVYDNKMWVIGGYNDLDTPTNKNDVWYSTDGITWTQATAAAAWSPRYSHTSLVYDNKMWVMGGSGANDVWWTDDLDFSDGQTWTQAKGAACSVGYGHTSLVYDNKMWSISGLNENDVWYTDDLDFSDGQTWIQATAVAAWSPRFLHTSLVYDNKMWVIGGAEVGISKNDVWYSTGYDRLLEVAVTVSWGGKEGRVIGEDKNLNGILDAGEDLAGGEAGKLDSPVKFKFLITDKSKLDRVFLGGPGEVVSR